MEEYKVIIELSNEVPENELSQIHKMIDDSFSNRAGTVIKRVEGKHRFIFAGNESLYNCLDLGWLELSENNLFMRYVKVFQWVDIDPDETCDLLETIARYK